MREEADRWKEGRRKERRKRKAKCEDIIGSNYKRGRVVCFSFSDDAKAIDCESQQKCGKFLKRWEYQANLHAPEKPFVGQK